MPLSLDAYRLYSDDPNGLLEVPPESEEPRSREPLPKLASFIFSVRGLTYIFP